MRVSLRNGRQSKIGQRLDAGIRVRDNAIAIAYIAH
jgi:hypothetical protein